MGSFHWRSEEYRTLASIATCFESKGNLFNDIKEHGLEKHDIVGSVVGSPAALTMAGGLDLSFTTNEPKPRVERADLEDSDWADPVSGSRVINPVQHRKVEERRAFSDGCIQQPIS